MHETPYVFIISVLVALFFLLKWSLSRWENKELRRAVEEYRDDLKHLTNTIKSLRDENQAESEKEDQELKVGSEVDVLLAGTWWVRGKIESICAASSYKKDVRPGFTFRAHGDKNAMWLDHSYQDMVVVEDADPVSTQTDTQQPIDKPEEAAFGGSGG